MKKSVVILIHIAFWLILFGTILMARLSYSHYPPNSAKHDQWMQILYYISIVSYPVSFYAGYFGITKLLKKKYFGYYAAFSIIFLYSSLFLLSNYQKEFLLITGDLLSAVILFIIIGIFSYYFIDWFQKKNKILLLEKQNADSNLALLRTQINPHFLFNTLHNIDAMIMNNQEKASKSLIKLSDIMRYMLHESQSDMVPLSKELEHIKNYVSLEQLRIKNPGFLNFTITGDYKDVKIAPMLFLPFIENAFKHSVDSDIENGITIEFVIDRNNITFICRNIYDKTDTIRDETHGIGLDTVRKRLELIYSDKHKLVIGKNNTSFNVELKIGLNEN